ncbi:hypothetical protein [Faecalibacter sp. LW9]|uniref:hypothetical protein n=1 Tax=Faecalibacter sp. LW9 TaxID=3103144 RepID=UPI002AFFD81E|nr:hypothetical protein [Faecalibacter sp. LW9]
MKKLLVVLTMGIFLQACIVSTATKAVTTVAKASIGVVKGTVKGVSWAVSKANGKIDKDRLNGTWKLVGIYNGSFEEYSNERQPNVSFQSFCNETESILIFKSKKDKFQPLHCADSKENWIKYKFDFGKNPSTREKENYIEYNGKNYITIIDVSNKNLVLEGYLINNDIHSGKKLYLFEKK